MVSKNFILSLFYKSEFIISHFKKYKNENIQIKFIVEPQPLGTGGAISYIIKKLKIKSFVYIVNGDTWMDSGYSELKMKIEISSHF